MIVLVCGPRDLSGVRTVWSILDSLDPRPGRIVQGGAGGADAYARDWALVNEVAQATYPADWTRWGRAAGPIRNAEMLRAERPDLVVTIKREGQETPGTGDMERRARRAGYPVRVFRVAPDGSWWDEAAEAAPGGGSLVSPHED